MAWIHAAQSKNRKAFPVPLNADAITVLKSQLGGHHEWVFTYNGRSVSRTSTRAWKLAKERAAITDFRWHDLRHTRASWHAQNGTGIRELMELGSWSSIQMVLRYAHLGGDHLKAPARH
jgi:integrase